MGNLRGRPGGAVRRRLALGGAIGLGGGVLAACLGDGAAAPGARGAARGTVTFMSQQAGAVDQGRYQPVVEQFNARGGPVTIDLQEGGGGIAEVQQKLVTTVAADTPPDVFWTHCYINPTLVKARIPADLGPFMRRERDLKPEAYFETSFKDYEWDGKQYGVALWATTTVLLANLGLFARNGVAPPQESWTWDDFLKAAQALEPRRRRRADLGRWRLDGQLPHRQGLAGGGRPGRQEPDALDAARDAGGRAGAVGGRPGHPPPGVAGAGERPRLELRPGGDGRRPLGLQRLQQGGIRLGHLRPAAGQGTPDPHRLGRGSAWRRGARTRTPPGRPSPTW